jgi:hypothetical protein
MAKLFGGATSVDGFGAWRDDEAAGSVILENVSVVISFMATSQWNREAILELRKHLHRMGRETQQGEVGLIVQGRYFPIREFDNEEEEYS